MPKKDTLVTGKPTTYQIPNPAGGVKLETFIPWTLVKRGVKKEVITPIDAPMQFREEARLEKETQKAEQDTPLVKALGLAHYWQRLLNEGKFGSVTEIAAAEGLDKAYVSRIFRLAFLSPDITDACLTQESADKRQTLIRTRFPRDWEQQRMLINSGI